MPIRFIVILRKKTAKNDKPQAGNTLLQLMLKFAVTN